MKPNPYATAETTSPYADKAKPGLFARLAAMMFTPRTKETRSAETCRGCGGKVETDTDECHQCWGDKQW
jgi:hypothetical protein